MAGERRDEEFEEVFDAVFPLAQRVAYRVLGDPYAAEDAAAEAFVRLYAHWPRVRNEPGRVGWVLRVTGNVAIDAARRKRPVPEPAPGVDQEDAAVLRLALSAALRALPQRQRGVVVLRYLADLSEQEVADMLGISAGTVKTHAHRGLQRLRRAFPAGLPEEGIACAIERA